MVSAVYGLMFCRTRDSSLILEEIFSDRDVATDACGKCTTPNFGPGEYSGKIRSLHLQNQVILKELKAAEFLLKNA